MREMRCLRKYWISGAAKQEGDSAPATLDRTEVVEAPSPEEAVAMVQRMHPDCTVMLAGGDHR